VQTDISGYVQNKSAWLNEYFRPLAALMKADKFRWDTYEEKDVQVRISGDSGRRDRQVIRFRPKHVRSQDSTRPLFNQNLKARTRRWIRANEAGVTPLLHLSQSK
jgi:hypothetical protein